MLCNLFHIRASAQSVSLNTEAVQKYPLEFHDVVKSEDFTSVTSLFNVDTKLSSLGKRVHPAC
jgi:hypothetical protein